MRRVIVCFIILSLTYLEAQQGRSSAPLSSLSELEIPHFQKLIEGNNRFAFDLYQEVKNQIGNFYFSPYSVVTGLGMIATGAKDKTERLFRSTFRYSPTLLLFIGDINESLQGSSSSKNISQVLLGNALWIDKSIPVLTSFKQTLIRNFKATLQSVDFVTDLNQTIQKINQWTLQQTKEKIGNIISLQDVNKDTRMVLTTSSNLNSQWFQPFDQKLTARKNFQVSAQRTILTDMMQNTAYYLLLKDKRWDALVIPYVQEGVSNRLAMVVFLPYKDTPLAELEKNLTWENWQQWKLKFQNQRVALTFPRFRIARALNMEMILKALGFSPIFNSEANFSGITSQKGIHLNQFLHKTSILINEKGADVIEAVQTKPTEISTNEEAPYEFIVDHPFAFIIWEQRTDSILFMGRLTLP